MILNGTSSILLSLVWRTHFWSANTSDDSVVSAAVSKQWGGGFPLQVLNIFTWILSRFFLPQSKNMQCKVNWKLFTLSVSVYWRANVPMWPCVLATVHSVTLPLACNSWQRLQQTSVTPEFRQKRLLKMDRWTGVIPHLLLLSSTYCQLRSNKSACVNDADYACRASSVFEQMIYWI